MLLQHDYMPKKVIIPHFGIENKIVGVEIGVLAGTGSLTMLIDLPNLILYSIDPWQHIDGGLHECLLSQEALDENYRITLARLEPYKDRSFIIRKPSDEAVLDVPECIDYLFIDGDHAYAQVLKDIQNYGPKVRQGGIIAGHDYIHQEGVSRAVKECFKDRNIYFGDDDTWFIYNN